MHCYIACQPTTPTGCRQHRTRYPWHVTLGIAEFAALKNDRLHVFTYMEFYAKRSLYKEVTGTDCSQRHEQSNTIFLHSTRVDQLALLNLQETFSLCVSTYAMPALCLTAGQTSELNACWYNVIRRLFGFTKSESVMLYYVIPTMLYLGYVD